jgi:hypothetical protein
MPRSTASQNAHGAARSRRWAGDEPARCTDMLFRDIAATGPPPALLRLWAQDFVSYHNRFSHLKGVSQ